MLIACCLGHSFLAILVDLSETFGTEYSDRTETILRGITRRLLLLNLGNRQITLEPYLVGSTGVFTEELTLCYRSNRQISHEHLPTRVGSNFVQRTKYSVHWTRIRAQPLT
jgi:hypothetical protein